MRKYALAMVMMCLLCSAGYTDEAVSVNLDAAINSKYVWRGQLLTDDAVFQPALGLGYEGFSVGIWGNMDLTNVNGNRNEFNELNYYIDYTIDLSTLSLSVGGIYYDFPNTDFDSTVELYAGVAIALPLSPSVVVYRDIDEVEGYYAIGSLEYSLELPNDLSLDFMASVGWGSADYSDAYFGRDSSRFTDAAFAVSLPIELSDSVTVTPGVGYTTVFGSLRGQYPRDDNYTVGLAVEIGF